MLVRAEHAHLLWGREKYGSCQSTTGRVAGDSKSYFHSAGTFCVQPIVIYYYFSTTNTNMVYVLVLDSIVFFTH